MATARTRQPSLARLSKLPLGELKKLQENAISERHYARVGRRSGVYDGDAFVAFCCLLYKPRLIRRFGYFDHLPAAWEYQARILADPDLADTNIAIVGFPGCGKSTILRAWHLWEIGHDIGLQTIWWQNETNRARSGTRFQRMVLEGAAITGRAEYESKVYHRIFSDENGDPIVRPDVVNGWTQTYMYLQGGGTSDPAILAVGIDGSYHGSRADRGKIDDPFDRRDVRSPTKMRDLRAKLREGIFTRFNPGKDGGRIEAVMNCLGPDDLRADFVDAGFFMVYIPVKGLFAPDEYTIPEQWNEQIEADQRRKIGTATFELQYELDENASERVGIAQPEWIDWINSMPLPRPGDLVGRFYDMAATKANDDNKDPDWTAGSKMILTHDAHIYIDEDWILMQGSPAETERAILNKAKSDGVDVLIGIEQEGGSAGKIAIYGFEKLLRGYNFRGQSTGGQSKEQRASLFILALEQGRVHFVRGPNNIRRVVPTLLAFPHGKHDDEVDSMSGNYFMLIQAMDTPDLPKFGFIE